MSSITVHLQHGDVEMTIETTPDRLAGELTKAKRAIEDSKSPAIPEDTTEPKLPRYKSRKVVHATPMTRGDYARYVSARMSPGRAARPPEGGFPDDPGYLVIYNRGTDDHYESWSPKHVFEAGNDRVD